MESQDARSVGYESYWKNKELHHSDNRSMVRGSFLKSTSSSNLATKMRTHEDGLNKPNVPPFDFVYSDQVLPTLLITPAAGDRDTLDSLQ
jgi:hypothetical protein